MRLKLLVLAAMALMVSETASAQQRPRPPQQPPNTVAPLRVEPRQQPGAIPVTPPLQPANTWVLDLSNGGRVQVQLRPDSAPNHVERIKTLTRQGFYNGLSFHRVIEGFMAQGGDPAGNGSGESTLPDLAAEFNDLPHLRGAVAAARTQDPNSANSQFYIMFVPRLSMDHDYTVFGRVVAGMSAVDQITRGEPPASPTRIIRASLGSDNLPPPSPAETAAVLARFQPPPAAPQSLRAIDVQSLTGGAPTQPGAQRRARPSPTPGATTPPR